MSMARKDGKIVSLEYTTNNRPMPEVKSLLKKGFVIKTEDDAKAFEAALDVLWPIRSVGPKKAPKEIKKEGGTWTFVRGTFSKDLQGFIVKTGPDGSIQSIDYSLEIKK